MKSLLYFKNILLFFIIILAVFSFCSCHSDIETADSIILNYDGTPLPEIKVRGNVSDPLDFRYENKDGFIYVFEGMLFFTEDAPSFFETELKLYHKKIDGLSYTIKVIRQKINANSAEIEIKNREIYPGEKVEFEIVSDPVGSYVGGAKIWVDKPEYVEEISDNEILLSADTPLGEKIKLAVTLENGVVAEGELSVVDKIIEISTPEQMEFIKKMPYGYFRLTSNIDMTGYNWTPATVFHGLLDGDGYTISGIEIDYSETTCFGLICNENYGIIRNLRITDSVSHYTTAFEIISVNSSWSEIQLKAGVVCGVNWGLLENLLVENCILENVSSGSLNRRNHFVSIGGSVCGDNAGKISKCGAINNKITANAYSACKMAYSAVGGFVGHNDSIIEDSYSYNNDIAAYCYGIDLGIVGRSDLFVRTGGFCAQSVGEFYRCVAADNNLTGETFGVEEGGVSYEKASFLSKDDSCKIVDCYVLNDGTPAVEGKINSGVTVINSISLSTCQSLSQEIWTEKSKFIFIKHEWR